MNIDRLKRTFLELIPIYSPYKNEKVTLLYIKAFLDNIGVSYYEDESNLMTGSNCGNLIVGDAGSANVSFVSHMDTIKIYEDLKICIDEAGVIKGENGGVIGIDDKCGIAIMLEMISALKEHGGIPKGVHFVFLTNEEIDFTGAKQLDERHFINAFSYVLDSGKTPIGYVVIKGANHYCYEIRITGEMSHVGNLKGVHSLLACSSIIERLHIGRISDDTVLNVSNVVCESNPSTVPKVTTIEGQLLSFDKDEARKTLDEIKRIIVSVSKESGCAAELSYECMASAFDVDEKSDIVKAAKRAAEKENLDFDIGKTGAGSDAHVINHRGGKAIKISTGMMNVHSDNEHININDMAKCVEFCLAIISCS